jgi:hypothetical protein
MSQRTYIACHHPVSEQHESPPNSFLDQLIDAINPLPDAVFEKNDRHDIYSVMLGSLGPYPDLLHRTAAGELTSSRTRAAILSLLRQN